jgi:GTP diphosphokinase / guanosine-3',5'-bis(diphosphate) 3'-diphosphatase
MDFEKKLGKVGDYSRDDLMLVQDAFRFVSSRLLKTEMPGENDVKFNVRVVEILKKSRMPIEIVVAGALYGCEKTVSFDELNRVFGSNISELVFGQLQLRDIQAKHKGRDAGLIRKILISGLSDIGVVFVKLAVKVVNLETIGYLKREERRRICEDVLDLYVPLAERLGVMHIRDALEDLAFCNLYEKKYNEILNFFAESRIERRGFLDSFIVEVDALLEGVGIVSVKGRDKSIRSIYRKITDRKVSLDKQKDHYAIRIIADSAEDCYAVLGVLHRKFVPVGGALKDYIANPKFNGYRSLHTAIEVPFDNLKLQDGVKNRVIEVQVRTMEMDEFAEEGNAAHWAYKGDRGDFVFEKKVGYLKTILSEEYNDSEFLKRLKLDLFADKIYCYTPKGDVKELPKGASVLDFAYSIHQEVGSKAVGARVDGKFVSLKEVLVNNCVVEVLANKAQRPRRSWLKFVVSTRARAKIRKDIRKYETIPVQRGFSVKVEDRSVFGGLVESEDFPHARFSLAKCCNPVPMDNLVGVMKSASRVLVHCDDCSKVSGRRDNVVLVSWKSKLGQALDLRVLCKDRSGILSDLLNTISRLGFVVRSANVKFTGNDEVECRFEVIPRTIDEVEMMVGKIGKVRSVVRVWFEC